MSCFYDQIKNVLIKVSTHLISQNIEVILLFFGWEIH